MRKQCKHEYRSQLKYLKALMVVAVVAGLISGQAMAYPKDANPHSQFLGGPYELLVQRGMQGAEMLFPVKVENESSPSQLDTVLPIMGSSAKIKLEQFLPELVWEQYTEKSPEGGAVVKLRAVGPGLDQEIWLCADETDKQSISSSIGGIAIKKVKAKIELSKFAPQLTDPNAVGILSVWLKDPNEPSVYVVSKNGHVQADDSSYKFEILEYLPHYSVDTETKAITNASPEPQNPAIRVKFIDGDLSVEQWLFSRFAAHPHIANQIPVRVEFTDCNLGMSPGNYIILVSKKGQPQMLSLRDGSKHAEEIKLNNPYPLAQEGYNLILEDFFSDVVLKQRWKNNRDHLLNPAIIATVDRNGQKQQVVLELNKPQHLRSESETMVMVFRRKVEPTEHLK
jgi:hypothetical protein